MTKFSQIKSTTNISKSSEKSKKTIRKKLGDIKPLPMKNIKMLKTNIFVRGSKEGADPTILKTFFFKKLFFLMKN